MYTDKEREKKIMLSTIYANRTKKSDIDFNDAKVYWFRNSKNQLVGIVSYGTLTLNDTVVLYTANSHRFVSFLDKDVYNTKGTIYYVCD